MVFFKQTRAVFRAFLNSNLTVLWLLLSNVFVNILLYSHFLYQCQKNQEIMTVLNENIIAVDKNVRNLAISLIKQKRLGPPLAIKSVYFGQDWTNIEQRGPISKFVLDIYQECCMAMYHYYEFSIVFIFISSFFIVWFFYKERPIKIKSKVRKLRSFIKLNYSKIVKKRSFLRFKKKFFDLSKISSYIKSL